MSFLDLARRRQSDRGYSDQAVSREQLDRCLEAARLAPSACNGQPWYFIAVDDPALRSALADQVKDLVMNHFVTTAQVLVAVVAQTPPLVPRLAGHWKNKPYYLIDIGIAAEHFCLQAADEGLGSCIIGWFKEREVQRLLGVPKSKRVLLVIALGYAQEPGTRPKVRKEPRDVWGYNGYRR